MCHFSFQFIIFDFFPLSHCCENQKLLSVCLLFANNNFNSHSKSKLKNEKKTHMRNFVVYTQYVSSSVRCLNKIIYISNMCQTMFGVSYTHFLLLSPCLFIFSFQCPGHGNEWHIVNPLKTSHTHAHMFEYIIHCCSYTLLVWHGMYIPNAYFFDMFSLVSLLSHSKFCFSSFC